MRAHFFLPVFFFLAACAHTAKTTNLQDLPNLPVQVTGAVLPIELSAERSVNASDGCVFSVVRVGDGRTYETDVPVALETLVIELPPGVYEYHDFYCGRGTWDVTHDHYPRFRVEAGKLSMLSGLKVYFTGAQNMTVSGARRTEERTQTEKFLGRVSEENRARLISGYTGKPIPPALLEKTLKKTTWLVVDSAGKDVPKGERDWPSFRTCYRGEDDVNSLWLGDAVFEATYSGGNLVSAKQRDNWHTFSEQFLRCANSVLKEFQPRSKAKLSYTLFL